MNKLFNVSEEQKNIIEKIKLFCLQYNLVDSIFSSADRLNVEAIIQVHKDLNLAYDKKLIQLVLDSFNLDSIIEETM